MADQNITDTSTPQTPPPSSITLLSLDDYFQSTPLGSVTKAISNNLLGVNHRQVPGMVPKNKDSYGLTFFVRPQLNMLSDNIRNLRQIYPLLSNNDRSIQRFIRLTLDPRLNNGFHLGSKVVPAMTSPFVDPMNAFIPVLTNNINTISGWPDMAMPTHTSKAGLYNEVYSQPDGIVRNFESFDIDVSFRNTKGDPILYMFYIWMHYMSAVFEGTLVPYPDMIVENERDYDTRIYRLVLDQSKTYVTKIAATGVSFPISDPTGSFFDYDKSKPFNDQNNDISVRFRCLGADFNDPITPHEFNATVGVFNTYMKDEWRDSYMIKLSKILAPYFNNRGYPRINPINNELEWWVTYDMYNARSTALLKSGLLSTGEKEDANQNNNQGD